MKKEDILITWMFPDLIHVPNSYQTALLVSLRLIYSICAPDHFNPSKVFQGLPQMSTLHRNIRFFWYKQSFYY